MVAIKKKREREMGSGEERCSEYLNYHEMIQGRDF